MDFGKNMCYNIQKVNGEIKIIMKSCIRLTKE